MSSLILFFLFTHHTTNSQIMKFNNTLNSLEIKNKVVLVLTASRKKEVGLCIYTILTQVAFFYRITLRYLALWWLTKLLLKINCCLQKVRTINKKTCFTYITWNTHDKLENLQGIFFSVLYQKCGSCFFVYMSGRKFQPCRLICCCCRKHLCIQTKRENVISLLTCFYLLLNLSWKRYRGSTSFSPFFLHLKI